VSLSDPDARPIRKGKPGRPTEFGYTVLLGECERGFIATYQTTRATRPTPPSYSPPCSRSWR
jgi:transposase, IS5 family